MASGLGLDLEAGIWVSRLSLGLKAGIFALRLGFELPNKAEEVELEQGPEGTGVNFCPPRGIRF